MCKVLPDITRCAIVCGQGDTSGALYTLTEAEIEQAKGALGQIASAIPGYDKLDPHCNGFVCNEGSVGQQIACDDAFINQKKADYCGVRHCQQALQCFWLSGTKEQTVCRILQTCYHMVK